MFHIQMRL